jgi:hypothetical protein
MLELKKALLFIAGFSMTIGAVDVIKLLNLLRSGVDITFLLLLESFGFLTLYSKVDLVHLKSCMKVLINSDGLMLMFLAFVSSRNDT